MRNRGGGFGVDRSRGGGEADGRMRGCLCPWNRSLEINIWNYGTESGGLLPVLLFDARSFPAVDLSFACARAAFVQFVLLSARACTRTHTLHLPSLLQPPLDVIEVEPSIPPPFAPDPG